MLAVIALQPGQMGCPFKAGRAYLGLTMKKSRDVIQPGWGAIFAIASAIISVVAAPNAIARSGYPYCAVSRGANIDYQDCSYATFAACLDEIRGLGGYCRPNARYVPPPVAPQRDRQHPRRTR
jgi:Protein of unknown function (DUF3551)